MKSTWEKKEKSTGTLQVAIDGEDWKKLQEKAFRKLAAKVKVNGFREGQAPEAMVRKMINGKEVLIEAVELTANDALLAGIKEQGLNLVDRPSLDIKSVTENEAVLDFSCTVAPEVKLGKYAGIEYVPEKAKVTAEEIKTQLEHIQKEYTEQVVKADGTVAKGDIAIIDFEGFKDGVAFDGGKGTNHQLEIGSGSFIPGFEDQLIGMKAGEEKDIKVTFPKDYGAKDLAGAEVTFKVKVNEVKQNVVPEINDDLVKDMDEEGLETIKDLENKIKKELTAAKEKEIGNKRDDELLKKATEAAEVEIPDVMIESETGQMLNDFKNRVASQGMPFEQYLKLVGQTEKDVREHLAADAPARVKTRLVLAQIAKEEKLEASPEEIAKEYQDIAAQYQMDLEKVKQYVAEGDVKYDLGLRKALDFIKDKAVKKEKDA